MKKHCYTCRQKLPYKRKVMKILILISEIFTFFPKPSAPARLSDMIICLIHAKLPSHISEGIRIIRDLFHFHTRPYPFTMCTQAHCLQLPQLLRKAQYTHFLTDTLINFALDLSLSADVEIRSPQWALEREKSFYWDQYKRKKSVGIPVFMH